MDVLLGKNEKILSAAFWSSGLRFRLQQEPELPGVRGTPEQLFEGDLAVWNLTIILRLSVMFPKQL